MESAWQRGAHVFCRWWIVSLANAIGISGWLHGCWTFHRISIFFFHFRCLLRAFCFAWFSLYKFHRLIFETWVCSHQLDMPILVHHSQYQHLWSKHVKTETFFWSSRHLFFLMKIALIHPTPKVCQLLLHHSLHNRSGTRRRRGRRWRRFAVHLGGKQARRSWF